MPLTSKQYTSLMRYVCDRVAIATNYSYILFDVDMSDCNSLLLQYKPKVNNNFRLDVFITWDNYVVTFVQRPYYYGVLMTAKVFVTEKKRKEMKPADCLNDFTTQCPK